MSNIAIQELFNKMQQLEGERHKIVNDYNARIREIMNAIETLSGKKVYEIMNEYNYDDESPDYIRNTEDGI